MAIPLEAAIQKLNEMLNKSDEFQACLEEEKRDIQATLVRILFVSQCEKFEPTASAYHLTQRARQFNLSIPNNVPDFIRLMGLSTGNDVLWWQLRLQLEQVLIILEHNVVGVEKGINTTLRVDPRTTYRAAHIDVENKSQYVPKRWGKGAGPYKDGDEFGDERDQ